MAGREGKSGSLSEIFTRDFLLLATINLAMFFGFQMSNVGLPVYVAQLGANAQVVGLVGTVMTLTAVIVRVFAGPLLDRFGRKGALVVGSLVMACSIFAYAIFPVVGIILGVRLIQGIGWGLGSTASSTMAADVIPKHRFAEGMGYFAMTNSISSALAPAVSVALVQGPGAIYMIYVAAGIV
ncbi:MAG: MFS transporter, partial [Eggerthellaceae bacterium]|nr:MFS transporter [Eggerthellaceae bacterium]